VIALAAAVRVHYLGAFADDGRGPAPLHVQEAPGQDFQELVRGLSRGEGFVTPDGEPRMDVAPLYPWLVAQLSPMVDSPAVLFQRARWAQCGLGALTAGFVFLFVLRAFHSRSAAVLAGLLAAFHPFWIMATAEIADGVLAAFLLMLALYLGARASFMEFGASWLFGLALAGLGLTRAALLPYALVSLLWFLHGCRSGKGGAVPALLAVLGFASGMAPWSLRNYEASHDVVPVVNSAYHHLWIGNHPVDATRATPAAEPTGERARAEAVRDAIAQDPAAALDRRLNAGLAFLVGEDWLRQKRWFVEGSSTEMPDDVRAACRIALPASLLFLFAFGLVGWRWSYPHRSAMGAATLAVLVLPLPYIVGHAANLSGPRLPLDGVLIALAAYAVVGMIAGLRGTRTRGF
jgi:hypothetical protein